MAKRARRREQDEAPYFLDRSVLIEILSNGPQELDRAFLMRIDPRLDRMMRRVGALSDAARPVATELVRRSVSSPPIGTP